MAASGISLASKSSSQDVVRTSVRTFTNGYLIALLSVALLLLTTQWFLHLSLQRQLEDLRQLHLAETAHLVSERLVKSALLLSITERAVERETAIQDVAQALDDLRTAHSALRFGSSTLNVPSLQDEPVMPLFDQLEASYRAVTDAALCLTAVPAACTAAEALAALLTHQPAYAAGMEEASRAFERAAAQEAEALRRQEIGMTALVLAMLGLEAALVIRPAARRLQSMIANLMNTRDALERSEAQFHSLAAHNRDTIALNAPDGHFVYVSGGLLLNSGYTQDELLAMDTHARETLVHPEDLPRTRDEAHQQVLRGDPVTRVEYRLRRKDGGYVWVESMAVPMLRPDGTVDQILTSTRDITERRSADEALRTSEARLRSLVESQSALVIRTDFSGRFTYANPAYMSAFNLDPQRLTETSALDNIVPEDRPKMLRLVEACLQEPGQAHQVTVRKMAADSRILWTLWEIVALQDADGKAVELQCMGFDITQRKLAEDALHESEDRFSTAFRSSPVPMVLTTADDESVYVEANEAFLELVGYTWDALKGRRLSDVGVAILNGSRDERMMQLAAGSTYTSREAQIRTRTGELRDIILSAQRTTINGRAIDIEIMVDVTERKRADTVAQENERLRASVQREQEYSHLVRQTVSTLSHDLRTPLAIISSSKDMLERYYEQLTPDKRQERFETIERQVLFIKELVNDLGLVLRDQLNERVFRPEWVNLSVLCQVTVDEMRTQSAANQRLVFVSDGSVEMAWLDETLITRVLLNLLTNALKYSPEGGEVRLDLGTDAEGWVILCISDQGVGIAPEDQPHIFEAFYRAANADFTQGTGLGLSIVKDCVDRHGGTIAVASELGRGTSFTVRLPPLHP